MAVKILHKLAIKMPREAKTTIKIRRGAFLRYLYNMLKSWGGISIRLECYADHLFHLFASISSEFP